MNMMVTPAPPAPPGERPMPRRRWWIPLMVVAAVPVDRGDRRVVRRRPLRGLCARRRPDDVVTRRHQGRGDLPGRRPGAVRHRRHASTHRHSAGLVGTLDSDKVDIYTEKEVFGDQTEQENRQENLQLMTYSKDFASLRGADEARLPGHGDRRWRRGRQPVPAHGRRRHVHPGVAGVVRAAAARTSSPRSTRTPINVVPDLPAALSGKNVGDTITLTFKRGRPDDDGSRRS